MSGDLAEFYLVCKRDVTLAVCNGDLKKVWELGKKLQVLVSSGGKAR